MLSDKQKEALRLIEKDPKVKDVFYGGAAGGGKSYLGCWWQITRRFLNPETAGFMGRNTLSDFKTTTLVTFFKVWKEYFADNPYRFSMDVKMHDKVVLFSNGSYIFFKDLSFNSNDPEFNDLGGMELTDAFIDEVPGITQKAKNVVYSRIRHKLINDKPVLLSTGNPNNNWVKHEYVADKQDRPIELPPHKAFVPAFLSDNPDERFRETYKETLLTMPEYDRMRLLEGRWDAMDVIANPFMHGFNFDLHVSGISKYRENLPVFISMDFNVNPLCVIAAHVFREDRLIKVHVFKEFEIAKGSIPALIDTLKSAFPQRSLIRVTGDAGGNRKDIRFRDNLSIYTELMRGLSITSSQLMIRGNPKHNDSRKNCNQVLLSPQFEFRINPDCIQTIRDMRIVACDSNNVIIKSNRNKIAENADFLDCIRYLIHNFVPIN